MKVLFLDVDGVLNTKTSMMTRARKDRPGRCVHAPCVEQLRRVVEATGAQVVLSSSWRLMFGLEATAATIREAGYDVRFAGSTPDLSKQPTRSGIYVATKRGEEIAAWLKVPVREPHLEVTAYAIVDDDSDMLEEQLPFFVQTHFDDGLTEAHADRLIEILGRSS